MTIRYEWTDQDRLDQADAEARLAAENVCIRVPPPGGSCTQGYDHTGRCDWWNTTYDRIVAEAVAGIYHE